MNSICFLKKLFHRITFSFFLAGIPLLVMAQSPTVSIQWSLNSNGAGVVNPSNTNITPANVILSNNLSSSVVFSTANGLTTSGDSILSGWNDTSLANAAFLEFSFQLACGQNFDVDSVLFFTKTSAGNITQSESRVQFSINGGAFTDIAPSAIFSATTSQNFQALATTNSALQAIAGGQTLTFRVFAWGIGNPNIVANNTRTLSIQNFTIKGNASNGPVITAVPGAPITVCQGSTANLSVSSISSGTPPYSVNWNNGGGSCTGVTSACTTSVIPVSSTIFTATVIDDNGACATFQQSITVNPTPQITPMTTSICSGFTFTSTPVNSTNGVVPVGTTYVWTAPSVTGGITGGTSGSGTSITGTLTNPTNQPRTATYTVTPTSGSCSGAPFILTVTVNPVPAITSMTNTTCSGQSFSSNPINSVNGIVPAGTSYSWSAPVVTGGLVGGVSGSGSSITGTLTNPTITTQTATYTVTPSSGTCVGTVFTLIVNVSPTAQITAMANNTCSGQAFSSTPVNSVNGIVPAGTTYSWSAPFVTGGLSGGVSGSGTSITGTLTNPTIINQTANYSVTPTSGTCIGVPFTLVISAVPAPQITSINRNSCSGVPFTVSPTNGANGVVPGGTNYSWTAPVVTGGITGGSAGSGSSITGTLTNPTNINQSATYTVTPTSGACIGLSFTLTVTVNPVAQIFPMTNTTCSGVPFTVSPTNGANGVVPVGTNYSWTAPVVTGGITGGSAGSGSSITGTLTNPTITTQTATYTVTPSSGTCVGTVFTLIVNVSPTAQITAMANSTCSGQAFSSTPVNSVNGIVPVGTTYSWSQPIVTGGLSGGVAGSGSSITGTLTNPTNINQTATYTVTPTSGTCTGDTFQLEVTVNPTPQITDMTNTVCSGSPFTSTPVNSTIDVVPLGTNYSWTAPVITGGLSGGVAGSGSSITGTLTNPTIIPQTATYTVTPTSGSCAGSTFTLIVTVNPTAQITAMITAVCGGSPFSSTPLNVTNGIVPAGTTYSWSQPIVTGGMTGGVAGSGSSITGTLTNPTINIQTATYTVTPTSGTCTGDTFQLIVTVNPLPPNPVIQSFLPSGFDNSTSFNICQGSSFINFLDLNPSQQGLSYTWTASPPSGVGIFSPDSANTVISFPGSGTFTVNVQTTSPASEGNCSNTGSNFTIVVDPANGDTISESRIIHKNPGNLLIYLDNTMDGYKWGYDSTATGIPSFVDGQVYQAFVPASRFILNDFPDTSTYNFWVMVFEIFGNDTCFSKVYFNGPQAPPRLEPVSNVSDQIAAQINPNPSNGNFVLVLSGNIYNNIWVRVINNLGEQVYGATIEKSDSVQNFPFTLPDLPAGLYYLDIRGPFGEQYISKILLK